MKSLVLKKQSHSIKLALILFIGLVLNLLQCLSKPSFDKQKWDLEKKQRHEMVTQIIKSRMLIGKSKNQIIAILGKADYIELKNIWTYEVCKGLGMGFTSIFLKITYINEKVVSAKEVTYQD